MGLSTALYNAHSGLTAASRRAEVTSHNIANATTEGYARRSVDLAAVSIGGAGLGVSIAGISVSQTPGVTADKRHAYAALAHQQETAHRAEQIAGMIGDPDDPNALYTLYDNLEQSLRDLAEAPQSTQAQLDVLVKAQDVTTAFNQINDDILDIRREADTEISRQVDHMNELLVQIVDLNKDVRAATAGNADVSELVAERKLLVDELSEYVSIDTYQRDNGDIAVYTESGLLLAETSAAEFSFSKAVTITSDMDLVGGSPVALSTLTVDGVDVTPSTDASNRMAGGSIAALFETRDVTMVGLQTQVDALANDLIDRFDTAAVEPGITPGDPGVFTDNGGAATGVAGLAGRLSVNALIDPDQGGSLLAIRDGIGVAAGDVGDDTHALALLDAMTSAQAAPAGSGLNGSKSAADFIADLSSQVATASRSADATLTLRSARYETYYEAETQANGVDMDYELQELTLIENAYSANARVMSVVDRLFNTLLEI